MVQDGQTLLDYKTHASPACNTIETKPEVVVTVDSQKIFGVVEGDLPSTGLTRDTQGPPSTCPSSVHLISNGQNQREGLFYVPKILLSITLSTDKFGLNATVWTRWSCRRLFSTGYVQQGLLDPKQQTDRGAG